MAITLYHHPFTRAGNVVWMLEEVGVDYELRFMDLKSGAHKEPGFLALNPMGKLPLLTDGDAVISESAAIGLYLADRYAYGTLAPAHDGPARGTYLRWALFAPSVIEPGIMAKLAGWEYKDTQAGWGTYEAMLASVEHALAAGDYLLGERFSMADMIFGGTISYMLRFKLLEARPVFTAYAERLSQRPAARRAMAKNAAVAQEHQLSMG